MHRLRLATLANARRLRTDMTDAERRLWYHLRRHGMNGLKFRRQHPFGPYILDFYCAEARLAVELDGGQHFEASGTAYDGRRTEYLEVQGVRVLRFTNIEALRETDAVLEVILRAVGRPSP
jgi:very-short-patch-repair endonuclease